MIKKLKTYLIVIALIIPFSYANGQDATVQVALRTPLCDSCHGPNGISKRPEIPTIAGFSYDGFLDSLNSFREKDRPALVVKDETGDEEAMTSISLTITDEEAKALASHYSAIPFEAAEQEYDPVLAAKGQEIHEQKKCEQCHSDGGSNPQDDAAILAGQWKPYLERQISHFKVGRRNSPKKMKRIVDSLTEDEIEALLHFYASNNLAAAR
jgi:sulfide dehydrogenase cytochrome subunit